MKVSLVLLVLGSLAFAAHGLAVSDLFYEENGDIAVLSKRAAAGTPFQKRYSTGCSVTLSGSQTCDMNKCPDELYYCKLVGGRDQCCTQTGKVVSLFGGLLRRNMCQEDCRNPLTRTQPQAPAPNENNGAETQGETKTDAPIKAETKAPTRAATRAPTEAKTEAPTKKSTKAPTKKPTGTPFQKRYPTGCSVTLSASQTCDMNKCPDELYYCKLVEGRDQCCTQTGKVVSLFGGLLRRNMCQEDCRNPLAPNENDDAEPQGETKTDAPTKAPTRAATKAPTVAKTAEPQGETKTDAPTKAETKAPTKAPTEAKTEAPTKKSTKASTKKPTAKPASSVCKVSVPSTQQCPSDKVRLCPSSTCKVKGGEVRCCNPILINARPASQGGSQSRCSETCDYPSVGRVFAQAVGAPKKPACFDQNYSSICLRYKRYCFVPNIYRYCRETCGRC
ncbi:salivary glue protein Sgs-3-like [Corticium candelabrum]|uniref:salivary glue protein Sgs-3-like n=1 Tax=Corticium candelabrum TaxID=121492 RepID=UPI002E25FCE9|nr:salivary glue protein Sgs-3-like [Corticium candelabrum]